MKLKYYLRGAGAGILLATLVMTVSSLIHRNNISDEYIIKEARKLGMVMKEEVDEHKGLWSDDDTEEIPVTEDSGATTEDEDAPVSGSEAQPSESESEPTTPESPAPSESESESTTPEPPAPSESESESAAPSESESESTSSGYVTIVVAPGDYARQVAEKLYAAGVIPDAEEFRKYMGTHGYASSIHAGTYSIPVDATYEEICKIVAG